LRHNLCPPKRIFYHRSTDLDNGFFCYDETIGIKFCFQNQGQRQEKKLRF